MAILGILLHVALFEIHVLNGETGIEQHSERVGCGNVQKNAKNGSFDYLAMQFRACSTLVRRCSQPMTTGILPLSPMARALRLALNAKEIFTRQN